MRTKAKSDLGCSPSQRGSAWPQWIAVEEEGQELGMIVEGGRAKTCAGCT
jgi:hypothetical protein